MSEREEIAALDTLCARARTHVISLTRSLSQAKIAELEKLRKKHDMLSMSLEEDAKRKTKSLQDELDAERRKAADLLSQVQELQVRSE